jgi:hypothetical protein
MTNIIAIPAPLTIDPPLDVATRRRLFYFQEDFSLAPLTYPSLSAPDYTYDEYLSNMAAILSLDLTRFPEVFLAPFRVADFDRWASANEFNPDSAEARNAYLAAFDFDSLMSVTNPDIIYAISATDYMATLAIAALHHRMTDGDEEDHVEALEDLMDDGEHVASHFADFLLSTLSSSAIVTYNVEINVDASVGSTVKLSNDLVIHLCGDHIHADSPEHYAMLVSAFALSQLSPASVFVRSFEDEDHPRTGRPLTTLYGFYVDRDGLKGLSASQIFDYFCTDEAGGPIPPEEGVVYADAPDIEFV